MRIGLGWALMFGVVGSASGSEPSCYRSSAEAAAQAGVRGVDGYRLESERRDVFSGSVWAMVKSCGHPERPGMLVLTAFKPGTSAALGVGMARRNESALARTLVMLAGTRVTLVETTAETHLEVSAIAQGSGAVGERVRVRLIPVSSDGGSSDSSAWASNERFAVGIVRSAELIEMVTP